VVVTLTDCCRPPTGFTRVSSTSALRSHCRNIFPPRFPQSLRAAWFLPLVSGVHWRGRYAVSEARSSRRVALVRKLL
jgi:hypothetical protein